MNTKNNLRFQETDNRIRKYFLDALQTRPLSQITVQEICRSVDINRSTFYAHYRDVYDLLEAITHDIGKKLLEDFKDINMDDAYILQKENLLIIIRHMKKYSSFYKAYMSNIGSERIEKGFSRLLEGIFKPFFHKIGLHNEHHIIYHFTFFKSGLIAVLYQWLLFDCEESPEEISEIIWSSAAAIPEDIKTGARF